MRLRRLTVDNYRGIKHCQWDITTNLAALVGPGDSTKTTLLDAIGAVLHPNYTLPVTDADFHHGDTSDPIRIVAVITDPPEQLLTENQLGPDCSGLTDGGELVHDASDDTTTCLVIQLLVGQDLEPGWTVERPDEPDSGRPISAAQRRALGFFRLGEFSNTHLRWSRTSALASFTEKSAGKQALLTAQRSARTAVFDLKSEDLASVTGDVQAIATEYGSAHFGDLRPGLEPDSASSANALLLHDGNIPLTAYGLGSRRLTSLAIQARAVPGNAVITIDEIEYGLEPHRVAHLLEKLRRQSRENEVQVLLTTHSSVVVQSLETSDLAVVRCPSGTTTVTRVPEDLAEAQGALRVAPGAVLGRRVCVGEGPTEIGFIRTLQRRIDSMRADHGLDTSAVTGLALASGDGNKACPRATAFAGLGYPAAALVDNDDRDIDADVAAAEVAGVTVLRWDTGNALEHQLANDLPAAGLQAFIDSAMNHDEQTVDSIRQAVQARIPTQPSLTGTDCALWASLAPDGMTDVRTAIGSAAHKKGWFKHDRYGQELATLVIDYWADLSGTTTRQRIEELLKFMYDETEVAELTFPDHQ